MANIRIQLDLTVPSPAARWLLCAALLVLCAGDLVSESVTLTTYYPAPSGVYSQMITTRNTYLARDGGWNGTCGPAPNSSCVGLGTPAPTHKLEVVGNGNFSSDLSVGGNETVTGNDTVGGNLQVNGNSNINGTETVGSNATINGVATVNGKYLHISAGGPGCSGTWVNGDVWNTLCPGGEYASFTPGLYVDNWSYQSRGNTSLDSSGSSYVLCCPK